MVTVRDGKVLSVRGDPADPYTRGFVCPKARFQVERHLSEKRPLHPMLKTGGSWERVSWDAALDILASRIRQAVRRRGPSSVFYYSSAGSTGLSKSVGVRLFRRLGAAEPVGSLCSGAGARAQEYDFGEPRANVPLDLLNSSTIVVWGRNPASTNIHLIPILKEAKRKGAKVILVDPIRSESAALADLHIQVRPATDAALALAMCNFIITEGLAYLPFVAAYTIGFHAFREHVSKYTLHWAERVTGVHRDGIADLARRLAMGGPAAILMGYGFQRHYGGGNAVRACDALAAVTGNVGRKGGGANYANNYAASRLVPLAGPMQPGVRLIPRARLGDIASLDPPVEVLVVSCANLMNQPPGAGETLETLRRIPFKVAVDIRWTGTCEEADLFLPAATSFEDEDVYLSSWHPRITYSQRCVPPRGEAVPDRLIWQRLAGRLGYGKDFDRTMEEWAELALLGVGKRGLDVLGLKGKTVTFPGIPDVAWEDGNFSTPSGRFEFLSKRAEKETGYAMATYIETPGRDADSAKAYPLRLISPRRIDHLHSQFYERLLSPKGLAYAYASGEDLAESGLLDGDTARVESRHGAVRVVVRKTSDVPAGIVLMHEGGSVRLGQGVNAATGQGETDMGRGAVYYDTFVRLTRDDPQNLS